MIPGALTSTCFSSAPSIGPLPSIGRPRPSTTRPSSPLPTGTETIRPVRLTVSPSRTSRSSPKMTIPTLSDSRLSAIPASPPGNSTSSPACTLSSPQTRATPSPTESTWPTSASSARLSKFSSCWRRTDEISAGRGSMVRLLRRMYVVCGAYVFAAVSAAGGRLEQKGKTGLGPPGERVPQSPASRKPL